MVLLSKLSLMAFTLIIILSATSLAEALDMGYMCRRKRLKQKGMITYNSQVTHVLLEIFIHLQGK